MTQSLSVTLLVFSLLLVAASAAAQPAPVPGGSATPSADVPAPAQASPREVEARGAFERGFRLLQSKSYDAALAEFERSRALLPTRGNTRNAAVCLELLGRHDEALDRLDSLMRDFPDLPAEDREAIAREVSRLREHVGFLDIRCDLPGARVVIDGRERGVAPLTAPLRVSVGTHSLRVVLDGYVPFENQVSVGAEQLVPVSAGLARLARSGRLRVLVAGGEAATVRIDGLAAGPAPWDGALAPGPHTVAIEGAPPLGSQPAAVVVREDKPVAVTLVLEPLLGWLRIDPVPRTGLVALDGVTLGFGPWEGAVRAGGHQVEASAEGFLVSRRSVTTTASARERLELRLERDPTSPVWGDKARPRLVVELTGAGAAALSGWGGALASCSACDKGTGLGGSAGLRGVYALPSGLRLGGELGVLGLWRSIDSRTAVLAVGPARTAMPVQTDDALRWQGAFAGAVLGFAPVDWPIDMALAAGVLFGSTDDSRTVLLEPGATATSRQTPAARYVRVAPELRMQQAIGEHWSWHAGVSLSCLVAITRPTWDGARSPVVVPSVGSQAVFPDEALVDSFVFLVEPRVGASFAF